MTSPAKGEIQNFDASTGKFIFVPNGDAPGVDSFTFRVKDDVSSSGTATMTIDLE